MKLNPTDIITIRDDLEAGKQYGIGCPTPKMVEYRGTKQTVASVTNDDFYILAGINFAWSKQMFSAIARGKHRQPISCNTFRYKTLSHIDVPCVNCRCDGEKSSDYEPIGNISEHVCDNCRYELLVAVEPCNKCKRDGNILTQFEPKQVKPSREDTERIVMEHMVAIRDAYKGYCDADIQNLYLCFTGGKISFFNNFWKEDSGTPINKYEED